jgi:hypothetical protein
MFVTASISDPRSRSAAQFARNGGDSAVAGAPSWQSMCASQSPNAASDLAERIRGTVQPTSEQAGSFKVLADALMRANARIQLTCPTAAATNANDRLDLMAARLLAMRQALSLVLSPLRKFYATLSDEQKARLDTVEPDAPAGTEASRLGAAAGPVGCGEADEGDWPTARIARAVSPRREQFQDLEVLRQTSAALGKFVATTCAADKAKTASERLDAAMKRVNVMRYAVTHVSPALDQFYEQLTPAQKARFASLGR